MLFRLEDSQARYSGLGCSPGLPETSAWSALLTRGHPGSPSYIAMSDLGPGAVCLADLGGGASLPHSVTRLTRDPRLAPEGQVCHDMRHEMRHQE